MASSAECSLNPDAVEVEDCPSD
eukprot:SAG11_NODE_32846_length_280_cov_1.000000_2_plen_22_part_01